MAEQPLRERLHGQLMLALYRCGRQAEALEAYRRARATLVEEIGVEPGAELRALQEAILAQDPALDAPRARGAAGGLEGGSPLLAGRDRELAELLGLLADAREGRGGSCSSRARAASERRGWRQSWLARRCGGGWACLHARVPRREALAAIPRGRERARDAADRRRRGRAGPDLLDRVAAVGGAARRGLVVVLNARASRRGRLGPRVARARPARTRPSRRSRASTCRPASRSRSTRSPRRAAASRLPCIARRRSGRGSGRSRPGRAPAAPAERSELRAAEADLSGDLLRFAALDERDAALRGEDAARRRRRCARSSGSPRSTRPTRSTSSGASGWWPSWSRGSWARRCSPWSDRPGSGKSSAVRAGLLPALAQRRAARIRAMARR